MTTPLPDDVDPMMAVTDPAGMNDFNRQLIAEFRANAGCLSGPFADAPMLLLTTVGAKTGRPHTVPISYIPHRNGYVVAASKSGAPNNPAWYHNLIAAGVAVVEVGGDSHRVRPVVTAGAHRARLYERFTAQWPMQAEYQANTTRQIPVLILETIPK